MDQLVLFTTLKALEIEDGIEYTAFLGVEQGGTRRMKIVGCRCCD